MKNPLFLPLAGFLIVANSAPVAQSQDARRPPDGGTREMLISILIPSVPNVPFTATVSTEWIRLLADGATITLRNHRAIARDNAGRIFQERRALVANDTKGDSPITQIEISDPVSHDLYICRPAELVCQVEMFSPPEGPHFSTVVSSKAPGSPGLEDLGKQFIGGVETIGKREIVLIQTGAIGNDRPITAKREFWYSPVLGINLISKRQDPRFGTQNFEVTDIVLGEPDARMFELPSGSKVIDLRKPAEISTQATPSN